MAAAVAFPSSRTACWEVCCSLTRPRLVAPAVETHAGDAVGGADLRSEAPGPGKVQRAPPPLRRLDDEVAPPRPAGLDDSTDARLGQDLEAVREREERVTGG